MWSPPLDLCSPTLVVHHHDWTGKSTVIDSNRPVKFSGPIIATFKLLTRNFSSWLQFKSRSSYSTGPHFTPAPHPISFNIFHGLCFIILACFLTAAQPCLDDILGDHLDKKAESSITNHDPFETVSQGEHVGAPITELHIQEATLITSIPEVSVAIWRGYPNFELYAPHTSPTIVEIWQSYPRFVIYHPHNPAVPVKICRGYPDFALYALRNSPVKVDIQSGYPNFQLYPYVRPPPAIKVVVQSGYPDLQLYPHVRPPSPVKLDIQAEYPDLQIYAYVRPPPPVKVNIETGFPDFHIYAVVTSSKLVTQSGANASVPPATPAISVIAMAIAPIPAAADNSTDIPPLPPATEDVAPQALSLELTIEETEHGSLPPMTQNQAITSVLPSPSILSDITPVVAIPPILEAHGATTSSVPSTHVARHVAPGRSPLKETTNSKRGGTIIPGSIRADGSVRKPIRIRGGHPLR